MKKTLSVTSEISPDNNRAWAGADDFRRRYVELSGLSAEDRAVIMRGVNMNAGRAELIAHVSAESIAENRSAPLPRVVIEGEKQTREGCRAIMLRLAAGHT